MDPILLTRRTVKLGCAILLGLGPPGQVEAACEDPPGPAANSAIPGSIPPPALKASTLARMRGVTVPPPPPRPLPALNTGSLFRKAWRGGGKVSTCQRWRGRSVPGREPVPACSGQPDRQRAARGGEQSLASWHGRHRGVPAQVPVVEPGVEVQEGQEVTRGSPVSQGFPLLAFVEVQLSSLRTPGRNCPLSH